MDFFYIFMIVIMATILLWEIGKRYLSIKIGQIVSEIKTSLSRKGMI